MKLSNFTLAYEDFPDITNRDKIIAIYFKASRLAKRKRVPIETA